MIEFAIILYINEIVYLGVSNETNLFHSICSPLSSNILCVLGSQTAKVILFINYLMYNFNPYLYNFDRSSRVTVFFLA